MTYSTRIVWITILIAGAYPKNICAISRIYQLEIVIEIISRFIIQHIPHLHMVYKCPYSLSRECDIKLLIVNLIPASIAPESIIRIYIEEVLLTI